MALSNLGFASGGWPPVGLAAARCVGVLLVVEVVAIVLLVVVADATSMVSSTVSRVPASVMQFAAVVLVIVVFIASRSNIVSLG